MFNKHRYDAKNIPDKNEIVPKIHKYQHDEDIKPGYWIFGTERKSTSKARNRIMRRQIHLFIGHKSTYRTECRTKTTDRRELYDPLTNLTA